MIAFEPKLGGGQAYDRSSNEIPFGSGKIS
jgi:hypothetical protein